jgi:hypothetical protein
MVTELSGVGFSHSIATQTGAAALRAVDFARSDHPGKSLDIASRNGQASPTAEVAGAFAQLRTRQEGLNQVASTVRELDRTVDRAGDLLGAMQEDLAAIVKMYPPYPLDNPERVSLLNSFGGLRRQIDALTFPPPESLKRIDAELGETAGNGAEISEKGKPEGLAQLLDREPMWDIPALDAESASDDEVALALAHIEEMQSFLGDLKAGMWGDVVSFVKQAESLDSQSEGASLRGLLNEVVAERDGIGRNPGLLEAAAESR